MEYMKPITDIQLDAPSLDTTSLAGDLGGSAAESAGGIFEGSSITGWLNVASQIGGWIDYGIQSNRIKKAQRAQNLYMAEQNRFYNPMAYQSTDSIFGENTSGQSRIGNTNAALAAKYRNGSLFS